MTDLKDGETTTYQGSGKKPYILRNIGGAYDCSCPAWRNQSSPADMRTCKHLIKLRGEDAEKARLGEEWKDRKKKGAKSKATKKKQAEAAKNKPPILLAHSWTEDIDPSGYLMSEKLDGVRAYWNGKDFISRLGNVYHAPDWFKKGMPDQILDGELFLARGEFQRCVGIVKRLKGGDAWKEIKYIVFDAPSIKEVFYVRMLELLSLSLPKHVSILPQIECTKPKELEDYLKIVEDAGGEGVMLRKPYSFYEEGRSMTLLKVKTFHDAEAKVIGYTPGKGRHKGRTGALMCETLTGIKFDVGTGLSDKERESPPKIGSIITYRYQELTKAGKPRFPSFLRERKDV